MSGELRFFSTDEALQHLANTTGEDVVIDNSIKKDTFDNEPDKDVPNIMDDNAASLTKEKASPVLYESGPDTRLWSHNDMSQGELRFSSTNKALQHLSNMTNKRIMVAQVATFSQEFNIRADVKEGMETDEFEFAFFEKYEQMLENDITEWIHDNPPTLGFEPADPEMGFLSDSNILEEVPTIRLVVDISDALKNEELMKKYGSAEAVAKGIFDSVNENPSVDWHPNDSDWKKSLQMSGKPFATMKFIKQNFAKDKVYFISEWNQ